MTVSRVGRPVVGMGSPPDPDATTEAQPARPADGDRHERDPGSQREVGGAFAHREQLRLAYVDAPSPAMATIDPLSMTAATRLVISKQVVLARLVRDGRPRPGHESVATADRHVLLLRPEEPEARSERQDRHQDERVGPVQMVEAVDRRPRRQPAPFLETRPKIRTDEHRHGDPREPVPDRPADGTDLRPGRDASPICGRHGQFVAVVRRDAPSPRIGGSITSARNVGVRPCPSWWVSSR